MFWWYLLVLPGEKQGYTSTINEAKTLAAPSFPIHCSVITLPFYATGSKKKKKGN
jgi:hypothetical protein